jgi:hypothetical protein
MILYIAQGQVTTYWMVLPDLDEFRKEFWNLPPARRDYRT